MDDAVTALIFLFGIVIGLGVTVLWLIIGWRMMKALERISGNFSAFLMRQSNDTQSDSAQDAQPDPAVVQQNVLNKLVQDGD